MSACPLMEHMQGFARSPWIPSLGKWLHRIVLETVMVIEIGAKHTKNHPKLLTKTYI
jgi:hypothetical protein